MLCATPRTPATNLQQPDRVAASRLAPTRLRFRPSGKRNGFLHSSQPHDPQFAYDDERMEPLHVPARLSDHAAGAMRFCTNRKFSYQQMHSTPVHCDSTGGGGVDLGPTDDRVFQHASKKLHPAISSADRSSASATALTKVGQSARVSAIPPPSLMGLLSPWAWCSGPGPMRRGVGWIRPQKDGQNWGNLQVRSGVTHCVLPERVKIARGLERGCG